MATKKKTNKLLKAWNDAVYQTDTFYEKAIYKKYRKKVKEAKVLSTQYKKQIKIWVKEVPTVESVTILACLYSKQQVVWDYLSKLRKSLPGPLTGKEREFPNEVDYLIESNISELLEFSNKLS
jgi:hypothetical protein